jgi:actin-related protein
MEEPIISMTEEVRMSRSSTKTTFIVFFDICSIVHLEFVPQGQTSTHSSTPKFCGI